jgi:hypothetical protein
MEIVFPQTLLLLWSVRFRSLQHSDFEEGRLAFYFKILIFHRIRDTLEAKIKANFLLQEELVNVKDSLRSSTSKGEFFIISYYTSMPRKIPRQYLYITEQLKRFHV